MIRIAIAIVLALLVLYGLKEGYPLLSGPSLSIESPTNYASAVEGAVTVSGVARHTETLTLNGGILLIDEKGRFSTSLTLPQGGAILSLTATDRFGRSVTKQRTVYIP